MSVVRPFATLLASVLLVATPVSSFAADASVAPSYQTGNRALDGIFADFERSVRSKGDNARLSNFLRESSGFRNGKISEGLRDEVLKNRIESVSKNLLANQVPSGVTTEQGRKTVISGLL